MSRLKRICVFCGSNFGRKEEYRKQAQALGREMAEQGVGLVYGGGNVGLMGEVARTVMSNGGNAVGVIPQKLYDLVEHTELSELHIVENMHARKAQMYDLADAFIALPGGMGTLDELAEIFAWYQLAYHAKPIGLLNVNNFYAPLEDFLDHMVKEGFLQQEHRNILLVEDNPAYLLKKISAHL